MPINESALIITSYLRDANDYKTASEIVDATGFCKSSVRRTLMDLQMGGIVDCRAGVRAKEYILKSCQPYDNIVSPDGLTDMERTVLGTLPARSDEGKSIRIIMKNSFFKSIDEVRRALSSLNLKGYAASRVASKADLNRHQFRLISSKTKVWYRV